MFQDSKSAIVFPNSHLRVILEARDLEDLIRQILQVVHHMRCQHRLLDRYKTDTVCCPHHGFKTAKETDQRGHVTSGGLWRDELVEVGQKEPKNTIIILLSQVILDFFANLLP